MMWYLGGLVLGTCILASALIHASHAEEDRVIICYYSSYALGRPAIGKFTPEDIDPTLCTHIIFAFVNLVDGTHLEPSNWNDYGRNGLYHRTRTLKKENPDLKILLAVGGWMVGSDPFIPMISSASNRRTFVRNTLKYLRKNGFDGLDIDWEFPGARGSAEEDKYKFTMLLKEMQTAFELESLGSHRDKLLLTVATAGGSYFIQKAYETTKIAQHLDYILLMAYNYHGSWNNFTGHHSGLYPRSDEIGPMRELNQEWTAEFWEQQGVPRSKIVVGIATYGMTFTLLDRSQHGLGAPSSGGGKPGKYTKESGILSYYEVCDNLKGPWNYVWIEEQKSPYAYYENQWVGFDDQHSVRYKAEFIRHNGYAGAFIWSVEMDDFRGECGEGKYPLLTTIYTILNPHKKLGYSAAASAPPVRMQAQTPLPTMNHGGNRHPRPDYARQAATTNDRSLSLSRTNDRSVPPHTNDRSVPPHTNDRSVPPHTNDRSVPPHTNDRSVPPHTDDRYAPPHTNDRSVPHTRSHTQQRQQDSSMHAMQTNKIAETSDVNARVIRKPSRRIKVTSEGRYIDAPHSAKKPTHATGEIYKCHNPGIHEDPSSCERYFVCIMAGQVWKLYRMKCPDGLGFDPLSKSCMLGVTCHN